MTNYNERLDDVLIEYATRYFQLLRTNAPRELEEAKRIEAKQAITSLIKELVVEARIDEMKLHRHEWELFGDRLPYKGESVSLPILLAYHDDRITELEAQQEEV